MLPKPTTTWRTAWPFLIWGISLGFLLRFVPNELRNGDAVVYQDQLRNLDFGHTTVHLGFFVSVFPVERLLLIVFGHPDYAFNMATALFCASSVVALYACAVVLIGQCGLAVAAASILLSNYLFVKNGVYAEVYVVQTFFLLLALYLWLRLRIIPAALSLAMAALVTPSSLLATPLFVLTARDVRSVIRLLVVAGIALAAFLIPVRDDFLFGGRGVLSAGTMAMRVAAASLKEAYEVFFGMFFALPFVIAGIIALFEHRATRKLGLGLAGSWIAAFALGERFGDVPVQLPNYTLLCLVGALGFTALRRVHAVRGAVCFGVLPALLSLMIFGTVKYAIQHGAVPIAEVAISPFVTSGYLTWLACFVLVVSVGTGWSSADARRWALIGLFATAVTANVLWIARLISLSNRQLAEYRIAVIRIQAVAMPDYRVVADWERGVLFEHIVSGHPWTGRWISTDFLLGKAGDADLRSQARARFDEAIAQRREIWVLGDHPSILGDLEGAGYVTGSQAGGARAYVPAR